MTKVELKEYLKENLKLTLSKAPYSSPTHSMVNVTAELFLEEELLSEAEINIELSAIKS